MHRGVGPPVGHGRLDLGDEHALAADLVERRRRVPVALGAHDDRLDVEAGVGLAQQRGDHLGLAQRQRRAPGGQAEGSHGPTIPWPRLQVEEDAQRLDEALAPGCPGGLLQEHRRLVQHLGQGGPRRGVHVVPLLLAQVGQLGPVPLQLGDAQRLQAGPQRRR